MAGRVRGATTGATSGATSGEVVVGVEVSVVFVEAGFVAVGFVAIGFVEVVFVVGLVKDSGALSSGVAGTVAGAVVLRGLRYAVVGVAIGLAGALAVTRVMRTLLFGVSATDPFTFAALSLFLVLVAVVASYLPARSAARTDPMVALRSG